MEKVLFFGASLLGEIAFKHLKDRYNIVGFLDNDPKKKRSLLCGLSIKSLYDIKDYSDTYIIITSMYDIEIAKQLIEFGIKRFGVFESFKHIYSVSHYDYFNYNDFSMKNNKICLKVENNSGSNTFILSKNVNENISRKYEIVKVHKLQKDNNYYYDILTSKILLTTHDTRSLEGQVCIQLWHGVPLKGLSYMSNNSVQDKEANHFAWSKLDYIISYSKTYSTLMNACYGVNGKKYRVLGMPRNDSLFNKRNGITLLKRILGKDLYNEKVVFYLPTFRETAYNEKNGKSDYLISSSSEKELQALNSFLEENKMILILKSHPEEKGGNPKYSNIVTISEADLVVNEVDLYEILGSSDFLITDYSSVYFDYLLLDRPIIFYVPDYDEYKRDRGFLLEPFNFWAPGEICKDIDSLKLAILKLLYEEDSFKTHRANVRDIIHAHQDARSCERIWDFIDVTLPS